MASASGGRARRKRRRSSSEAHEHSAITSYLHRNESNFSTWQLTTSFFGPARLDTGLFVPRRLVCLLLSFLRSIPCFHEHAFFVLHRHICASRLSGRVLRVEDGRTFVSFSSPFRLHLFFFFRRVLKALPLLPYAGWHAAARVREWDRVSRARLKFPKIGGCTTYYSVWLASHPVISSFLLLKTSYSIGTYTKLHPTPAKSRSSALLANQCLPSKFP